MKKLALLLVSLSLTACVSSSYLAKQQYLLQAHKPLFTAEQPVNASLTVDPTLASPPFNNVQFIYRVKNSEYLNDYYNIFMTEPATQISAALTQFLQQTNIFTTVNPAEMTLPSNYILKTQLTELYADYSDDTHPKAVMEIQFILLNGDNIVYHVLLAAHAPLAHKSTVDLVHAWNKDLRIISTKFSLALMRQFNLKQANHTQTPAITSPQPTAETSTTADNNFLSLTPSQPTAAAQAAQTTPNTKPQTATSASDDHGFLRLDVTA